MASMFFGRDGTVNKVDFPEEAEALLNEPFLMQMMVLEPTAFAIMVYTSEQKKNGYSRDELIKFAEETFRDEGFTMSLPIVGRVQYTPKNKYDSVPDVERSLDMLLDSGLFSEKYALINGVLENRYFLIPAIAKYLKVLDVGADIFKKGTFEDLFYEYPDIMGSIYKKLCMEDDPDAENT